MEKMMMRLVVVALFGAALVSGCGGPAEPDVPVAPTTAVGPVAGPEREFLSMVRAAPAARGHTDAGLVQVGHYICTQIGQPGMSREVLIEGAQAPFGTLLGGVIVDGAKAHLCPEKNFATLASALTLPPLSEADLAEAKDVGPKDVISVDGQWHVGTEPNDHIQPGRYRTNGSSGSGPTCYYAKLDPADPEEVLSNSLRDGPREVVLNEGDFFETQNCGTWTRQEK
jgi:hypothetical protein